MKITVLGKGNAGVLTALHFHYYGKVNNKNIEVTLMYDSNTPPIKVGQATVLGAPNFLWTALGTDYYNNKKDLNYTMKNGILYKDWGKTNKEVFAGFPLGAYALHYNTNKFQNHILKHAQFKVDIVDEKVLTYDKIDADYIIDCRGWPKDFSEYDKLINPLNSVITSNFDRKEPEPDWTECIASKDGWTFRIPLYDTVSTGYLYNNNITTEEEAEKNFRELMPIDHINEKFSFKQYIKKKPIDGRVAFNGNQLFFLEPMESTAVETYIRWNEILYSCFVDKEVDTKTSMKRIRDYCFQTQNFILWHYAYGSKYDTPFWSYAKKLSDGVKDNHFDFFYNHIQNHDEHVVRTHKGNYSQWQPWNFKVWYDGMTRKEKV